MSADKPERVGRRLAAIMAADVAGYSRLMGVDEEGTLVALKTIRAELGDPKIAEHRGRIVKTTGDGMLVEFQSVVDAVRCAVAVQEDMAARNADTPEERRIQFRIGINLGDIISDDNDIYGDGVNVAARLEALAEPGGICVSGTVHDQVRDKLDIAFDDHGEQQVKNIARPVHVFRIGPRASGPHAAGTAAVPAADALLALPDKPSLAVLPFQNMSGDPEQEYFADGMVEEITTAIARLPWLFVIARNSSFTYKGRAVDVKQVARELGVRYVLEGSVRKAGNRLRITGQLIDTATGAHIWADRFDGTLDDIFELQDQVASSVAGAIEPKLRQSEIERASHKPTEGLDVYDLFLRAMAESRTTTLEGYDRAIDLLRRALAIEPSYAPAVSLLAEARAWQSVAGVALAPDDIAEALRLARQAIDTGGNDSDSLARGAFAFALLGGAHAVAMRAIERALALNPNFTRGWDRVAAMHCWMNQPEAAIEAVQRAIRLSPLDPNASGFHFSMGQALMLAGRYEEAVEWVDRSLHDRPGFHPAIRGRLALCGYLGRQDEAREWIAKLLAVNPVHTVAWFKNYGRFLSPATLAIWVEGLRRAGLPEE
jgi:TolB-like protein/class 3 adenylate cyclase/Tfp pilus assembly protein PilF